MSNQKEINQFNTEQNFHFIGCLIPLKKLFDFPLTYADNLTDCNNNNNNHNNGE